MHVRVTLSLTSPHRPICLQVTSDYIPYPICTILSYFRTHQLNPTTFSFEKMKSSTVHFFTKTKIYLIPTAGELSPEEFEATYRTPQDEVKTQQELVKTIMIARQNNGQVPHELQDEYTTRGIEHMASNDNSHMQRRKVAKKQIVDGVLDEQDLQFDAYDAGKTLAAISDPTKIAAISTQYSQGCRMTAVRLGREDAAAAADVSILSLETSS